MGALLKFLIFLDTWTLSMDSRLSTFALNPDTTVDDNGE
jgi:hypothetical protein